MRRVQAAQRRMRLMRLSAISLRGPSCRRSTGVSVKPPGGRRIPAPIPFVPRKVRPGSAAYGFRRIAARAARLVASCRTLQRGEHEFSILVFRHSLNATLQRLDGAFDGQRVAAGVSPDVAEVPKSDPARNEELLVRECVAYESLRLAQLLRLRSRGGALGYGGETGLALLVAAPYGLKTRGARLGLRGFVATVEGAAVQLPATFGQLVGL